MSRRAGSTWCPSPSSSSSSSTATPSSSTSASRITPREAGFSSSTSSRSTGMKRRGVQRASTPPTSSPPSVLNGAASPHSSPTIAVKFAGKIFRTLDTKLQGVEYSSEANFLGEPDEQVGDLERERADERRKRLERAMLIDAPETSDKRRRSSHKDGSKDAEPTKRARTLLSRHDTLSSLSATSSTSPIKAETPTRRRLGRYEVARTPSPPPAPFLARTIPTSSAALSQAFSLEPSSKDASLPQPLADLVALHAALEGALIMHLGTAGWAVASSAVTEHHPDGSSIIRIPNLVNLDDLSKMLQSGAHRFGQRELARLVWAWQGCELSEGASSDGEMSDDELIVEHRREGEAGGLGFIVSRTRVGRAGKIENTYGVGISVSLKSNPQLPKFELLPPTSPSQRLNKAAEAPPSPSSLGRGRDGMSVVALWTQGKNARRTELERRLRAWGRRCSRAEQARINPIYNPSLPPFPSELPEIPRATLPSLEAAAIAIPGTSSPSPKKPRAPLNDVFGPAVPISGPNRSVLMLLEELAVKHPSSAAKVKASERNRMMRERLAAKHAESLQPSTNQAFLSSIAEAASPTKSLKRQRKGEAEEAWSVDKDIYKRNAIISRLGNVADVVAMFSNKCGGRPSLVYDVALAVANSPLVKIGEEPKIDEAMESLQMLCDLFPEFSTIKAVDRQDWLYLKRDARPTVVKARVAEELEAVRRRGTNNLA